MCTALFISTYICYICISILTLKLDKTLKITSLKEKNSDFTYWSTKSFQERIDALELLREQYIKFNKDAKQGFQRVCRIVKQKPG